MNFVEIISIYVIIYFVKTKIREERRGEEKIEDSSC